MVANQYKKIKPLVIGIGVQGKRHLDAQLNLGIKTGIYSTNPQTIQTLRKNTNVLVFDDLQEAISWSNLVHVCTPDDKHTEFVAAAVKKGKVVLCEKSFTTSLKDALYLHDLAHKYNATVIVGQNYRLTPTFLETKKRVLEGQLGKITHIETTYFHDKTEYQKKYSTENFLYIGGSHAVDLACWIAGEPVVNVHTTSHNPLTYHIILKFASGLLGDIKLDASSPQSRNGIDLKVFGKKGKLVSHNKDDRNKKTHTIVEEVKIVDDYLSGKLNSFWPLPDVDQAVKTIKILDCFF